MKARKILTLIISFVLIGCFQIAQAQTFQQDLYATITNEYVLCADRTLSGDWNYHMSYHLDPKTGELKNLRWNMHANLYDEFDNKYKIMDVGSDNLGVWWDLFNNINAFNADFNIDYEIEDGWLPGIPDVLPVEGRIIESNYKLMGNGEKFTWKLLWIVRLDKDGLPKLEIFKETFCE